MKSSRLKLDLNEINSYIHQAILDPHINDDSFNLICEETVQSNCSGLCTSLIRLPEARKRVPSSSKTKLITVLAFPFGDLPKETKLKGAKWAIINGADQLDVVPNLLNLYKGKLEIFAEEIAELCDLGIPIRAILDINRIPREKLLLAIEACIDAGVNGIQSGNGFGPAITSEQILYLTNITKGRCSIKAVGGVKRIDHAIELLKAGCQNIGTSFGLELLKELKAKRNND